MVMVVGDLVVTVVGDLDLAAAAGLVGCGAMENNVRGESTKRNTPTLTPMKPLQLAAPQRHSLLFSLPSESSCGGKKEAYEKARLNPTTHVVIKGQLGARRQISLGKDADTRFAQHRPFLRRWEVNSHKICSLSAPTCVMQLGSQLWLMKRPRLALWRASTYKSPSSDSM